LVGVEAHLEMVYLVFHPLLCVEAFVGPFVRMKSEFEQAECSDAQASVGKIWWALK
jgi:hypothetical protein